MAFNPDRPFRFELKQPDGSWKVYQHPKQKVPSRWADISNASRGVVGGLSKIKHGTGRVVKETAETYDGPDSQGAQEG